MPRGRALLRIPLGDTPYIRHYAEGRYTKPSRYNFDYIALGVRFHGPDSSRQR